MRLRSLTLLGILALGLGAQVVDLKVGGSSALAPLVEQAAKRYMAQHKDVRITVTRSGSRAGMEALAAGQLHLALSDVEARPVLHGEEYAVSHLLLQAFVFVAHPQVRATSIDPEQARQFFLGQGGSWPGGEGERVSIVPVVRTRSSGTAQVQKVLTLDGRDFDPRCLVKETTEELLRTVARTPGAVGFVELSNALRMGDKVKLLAYDGVPCDAKRVKDGSYRLLDLGRAYHRPAHLSPAQRRAVEAFIAAICDPDFQMEAAFGCGGFPVQWYRDLRAEGVIPRR